MNKGEKKGKNSTANISKYLLKDNYAQSRTVQGQSVQVTKSHLMTTAGKPGETQKFNTCDMYIRVLSFLKSFVLNDRQAIPSMIVLNSNTGKCYLLA